MNSIINGYSSWGNCSFGNHKPSFLYRPIAWYTPDATALRHPPSFGFVDTGKFLISTETPHSLDMFNATSPFKTRRNSNFLVFDGNSYIQRVRTFVSTVYPNLKLSPPPQVVGWCSWNTFGHNLTFNGLRNQITLASRVRLELDPTFKYILIDYGYSPVGDIIASPNKQWVYEGISYINDQGLTPGLWINIFSSIHEFEIQTKINWYRRRFMQAYLPNTQIRIQSGVVSIYDQKYFDLILVTIRRLYEMGVRLFKFDFNLYLFWQDAPYEKILEIYRNMYTQIRLIAPDAVLIGCGVPLFDSIGLFDYVRITKDTHIPIMPTFWPRKLLHQIRKLDVEEAQLVRGPFNGYLWHADSDLILSVIDFHTNHDPLKLAGFDLREFFKEKH